MADTQLAGAAARAASPRSFRVDWRVVLAIAAVFSLVASARSLIPGVNEPHYLAKARHFWIPDWCGQDLFLTSANAHWFFYATVGWLAAIFPLSIAALLGRIAGWLTLAWGWRQVCSALGFELAQSLISAALLAALGSLGSLSGEWMVGGVESKVFAYGLLFGGVGFAIQGHLLSSAACLGFAVAFHPLAGGWGVTALAIAALARRLFSRDSVLGISRSRSGAGFREDWLKRRGQLAAAFAILGATALPGLLPAVAMLWSAPSGAIARQATEIQVFDRLDHHLLPERFAVTDVRYFGVLFAVWITLCWFARRGAAWGIWRRFVAGSVAIAILGIVANFTPWQVSILKFYPFRLVDALLPCAVAVELAATGAVALDHLAKNRWPLARILARPLQVTSLAGPVALAALWPAPDRIQPRWRPENRSAWIEVCRWVKASTPVESLFLTPRYNFGFKWWAERAEFAVWKDCPQDAGSLVEWKSRLDRIQEWRGRHIEGGFTREAIQGLAAETGVEYVVAWNVDPYDWEPEFRNSSFSVYHITPESGK